jgi:hypothetical protein
MTWWSEPTSAQRNSFLPLAIGIQHASVPNEPAKTDKYGGNMPDELTRVKGFWTILLCFCGTLSHKAPGSDKMGGLDKRC